MHSSLGNLWQWNSNPHRVLARPHLMALFVIFPIHVNFPIRSRCVLKAIIHRKKQWIVLLLLKRFFFFKTTLFYIVYASSIWLIFQFYRDLFLLFMFLHLSSINYFCHIMFYTRSSFETLINDRLRVSKITWDFRIPIIYNFAETDTWNLLFS